MSYCLRRRALADMDVVEPKPRITAGRISMKNKPVKRLVFAATIGMTPASAQQVYKIGISAGLTGYAATLDRGWRDGVEITAAFLNAKGGIMGRKLEVITEDNKSEPQEAVTVYRKMMSS